MKEEALLVGYVLLALITIITFVGLIVKLMQPINLLNIAIQELRDLIAGIKETISRQNKRLDDHGRQLDELRTRIDVVETKVNMYHKGE